MKSWIRLSVAAGVLASAGIAAAQQGVSQDEVRIGTIQDLSGPLAAFGKQSRNGMQMRVDEITSRAASMVASSSSLSRTRATTPRKPYWRLRSW